MITDTFHLTAPTFEALNDKYERLKASYFYAYPPQGYDSSMGGYTIVTKQTDGEIGAVVSASRLASCD